MSSFKMIQNLIDKYEIGRLSHAFLIETNNIDLCLEDIKLFIKYINCSEKYNENCTKCNLCKLIDLNNLPSLMIIEPDGMSIKKNQLQELQDQFSMKPVYSKYNSYVIMNAELMNASSANSILKFLEEPTDHIIGFLVTNNKEKMLDTIISRCQNLKFIYDDKSKSDEKINIIANEYLEKIENDNSFFGFGRDSGLRPDLGAANPVSQAEFHILRRTLRLQVAADALADRVRLHRLSGRHALRNERYLRLYSVV